jgi:hypothetical protein
MAYGGIPDSTRVIFPRPEGVRGLLVPHAHLIVDGVQQIVTPDQYARLRADGLKSREVRLQCPCGTGVNFTSAHRHLGTFDIPDHFKTAVGESHKSDCGYHTRKAARDLVDDHESEYDPSKPLRINLNFKEAWIKSANLGRGQEYIFERDSNGLAVPVNYKDWEPYSVTSLTDLVRVIADVPIDRLLDSVAILNGQAVKMREFLMTSQSRNWTKFYNAMDEGFTPLRLFAFQTQRQQTDLFAPPPSTLNSSQIESATNAPDFKGNRWARSFALNPRLPADPELVRTASETGLVFVLSVPNTLKRVTKNNGCAISDLSIPVNGSEFVQPISHELWQKMRPPVPEFKAA